MSLGTNYSNCIVSTLWSTAKAFQNLNNNKLQRKLSDDMYCPSNKVIKSDTKHFLALGGLHEDKRYATLYKQWHRPIMSKRLIKPPNSISRTASIDSDCCRLPTASVLSNKAEKSSSNPLWATSPSFLTGPHAFGPKNIYFVHKILMKQPHDCSY